MKRFDVPTFLGALRSAGCQLGEPFSYFEDTDSTNRLAKQAAKEGALTGSCFLADHQTGGRGRHGRSWHASAAESLLFSVLLRPQLPPDQLSPLTLALGLGVREALATRTSTTLKIKWPNDIVAIDSSSALAPPQPGGPNSKSSAAPFRKLAGILTESEAFQGSEACVIAGIGINVHAQAFPAELSELATSLALLPAKPTSPNPHRLDRELLLVETLTSVERWLIEYQRSGFTKIHRALNEHDALFGLEVRIEDVQGTGQGIDERGQLLVRTQSGTVAVGAGSVELARAP